MTLKRLIGPFRKLGLQSGLLYTLQHLLLPLQKFAALFVYDLVEQPVASGPSLPPLHAAQMRWVEVGPDSAEVALMPPPAAVKQMRFDQGARCIAVYRKDDFIGYVWFCFKRYEEDEVRCVYVLSQPAQSAFDFDLYIFPPYRLGRAFASVWDAANAFLRANRVTHTYSRISRFNLASRQAHARLGARVLASALFLRLGRLQLSWSRCSAFPQLRLTLSRPVQLLL